ncbi:MAG TPA: hypothetical protein VFX11_15765, partial [Candidatus Kapabacteria bacterium]|nr:hypothetical protein [Candidatus Kapabacteria bacterium]
MVGRFRSATKHLLGLSVMLPLAFAMNAAATEQVCPVTSPANNTAEVVTEQGPDYGDINRVLLLNDDEQRRTALRHLLHDISTKT